MDIPETISPEDKEEKKSKRYEFKLLDEIYSLNLQTNPEEKIIIFDLVQRDKLSCFKYNEEFKIEMLKEKMKSLPLNIEEKKSVSEIFDILDEIFMKNNIYLKKSEEIMNLVLKIEKDENEGKNIYECNFELSLKSNTDNELIKILLEEVSILKEQNTKYKKIIKGLIEKNKKIEYSIDLLFESFFEENRENKKKLLSKNNKVKNLQNNKENHKIKNNIQNSKELNKNKKNVLKKYNTIDYENNNKDLYNNIINFKTEENKNNEKKNLKEDEPKNFIKIDSICNNRDPKSISRVSSTFVIYTGIFDNKTYLAFKSENNIEIEIMIFLERKIVCNLNINENVEIIKYYKKNNKKDYLLSSDSSKSIKIWDIQQNFENIIVINDNFIGKIYDAILLFNIQKNDYIIISNTNVKDNIYTKIYNFKTVNYRNIYKTNENYTYFLIPWEYNNNYYIIECCRNKISIHDIFNDNYLHLKEKDQKDECPHTCGFIDDNNKLYVNNRNKNYITIWNLENQQLYKKIYFQNDIKSFEFINWNNIFSILGINISKISIVDKNKGKIVNNIDLENNNDNNISKIKKFYSNQLGELLICTDIYYNFYFYSFKLN